MVGDLLGDVVGHRPIWVVIPTAEEFSKNGVVPGAFEGISVELGEGRAEGRCGLTAS